MLILVFTLAAAACASGGPGSEKKSLPAGGPQGGPGRSAGGVEPGGGRVVSLAGPGFCEGTTTVLDLAPSANSVRSMAVDPDGTIFVEAGPRSEGAVRRSDAAETRIIQTGLGAGADRTTLSSRLPAPSAARVASDGKGGFFVNGGSHIIQVDRSGSSLVPIAGDPAKAAGAAARRSTGDGGPASDARFKSARSIAADERGNLYVADQINPVQATLRIRAINLQEEPLVLYQGSAGPMEIAPAAIDTIAGAPSGDPEPNAPAKGAVLQGVPPAMAVRDEMLYLALYRPEGSKGGGRLQIRVINLGADVKRPNGATVAPGEIETILDQPGGRHSRQRKGIASPSYVSGLDVDQGGNVFFADPFNNVVRRLDNSGGVSILAGTGKSPAPADRDAVPKIAKELALSGPYDVKAGPFGRVFFSESRTGRVLQVSADGLVEPAPGNSLKWRCGGAGKGSASTEPGPGGPMSLATDRGRDIFFTNTATQVVMVRSRSGEIRPLKARRRMVCRTPSDCRGSGEAIRPRSLQASAITFQDGLIWMADPQGKQLLIFNPGSKPVALGRSRIAPGILAAVGRLTTREGPSVQSGELAGIRDLAAGAGGTLYATDRANARVASMDAQGRLATVAGEGAPPSAAVCCRRPWGLAVDRSGNLLVSDGPAGSTGGGSVWFINLNAAAVTAFGQDVSAGSAVRIAGNPVSGAYGREGGPAAEAGLAGPRGLALDDTGNLYIADTSDHQNENHAIRKVNAAGKITTVAGTGRAAFNGDGLPGGLTALNFPSDLLWDGCGYLLVADTQNDRVRQMDRGTAAACTAP